MTPRFVSLAALALLAGCATPPPSATPPPGAQSANPAAQAAPQGTLADTCRPDPAGTLVTVDRGIGGTGINGGAAQAPGDESLADRGIGGTGIGGTEITGGLRGVTIGERGGGGTGITGVITGFGSICINGFELALGHPRLLSVDGASEASRTLHAGDVAAVEAAGTGDTLRAVGIIVRHDVSGPITAVAPAGDALDVAGQHVVISPSTKIAAELRPGAWATVSGLRDPAYAIHATRIEARAPGDVLVAGIARQVDGEWRIGGLRLRLPPRLVPGAGRIVVGGDYADGTLRVTQMSDDPLVHPTGGPGHLFIEGYPSVAGREVTLPSGLAAGIGPAFGTTPPGDRPIILELVRQPDNALLAVGWREARQVSGGHARGPDPQVPAVATTMLQNPVPPATPIAATTTATAAPSTTASVTASAAGTSSGSTTDTSGAAVSTGAADGSTGGLSKTAGVGAQAPAASTAPAASVGIAPTPPPSRGPSGSISEGRPGIGSAPGAGAEGGNDGGAGKAGSTTATGTGTGAATAPSASAPSATAPAGTGSAGSSNGGNAGGGATAPAGGGTTTTMGSTTTGGTGTTTGSTTGGTPPSSSNGVNGGSGGSIGIGIGIATGRTPPSEGNAGTPSSSPVGTHPVGITISSGGIATIGTGGGKFNVTSTLARSMRSVAHAPASAASAAGHPPGR